MENSKEEEAKQENSSKKKSSFPESKGNGENLYLQRADKRSIYSWSRGRIRYMKMPRYVYVLIDRRTGEAYKTKNREMPWYSEIRWINVALRNIAAYRDVGDFKVVQYELVEKETIVE